MRKANRNIISEFKVAKDPQRFVEGVIQKYVECGPAGADNIHIRVEHNSNIVHMEIINVTNPSWVKKFIGAIQYSVPLWNIVAECTNTIADMCVQLQKIQKNEKEATKRARARTKKVSCRSTSSKK